MNIRDIQALIDNTATIYTKIEVLPKVIGESIITLTSEDSIKQWVYSDLRNVENQGFIGQFVARTLDGELQNISDDFDIEDREIILYLGVNTEYENTVATHSNENVLTQDDDEIITQIGTYQVTYYSLGNFFVEKPKDNNVTDVTKYQSIDYTILFNVPFNPNYTDTTFIKSFTDRIQDEESITALWLLQYVCAQVGVALGSTNFDNNDFIIDSNQYNSDNTCRDVVKSIAKLAFTWARIGWDNKLYLDFSQQTTVEDYNIITNDNYYSLNIQKEVYGEINKVLTGSSIIASNSAYVEDSESIAENGVNELAVYDNPILYTQELREQAITAGRRLLGLAYQPLEMETTGHPWLLGNELIKVVDMEGNDLYTYPLDRIITFNGHIRTKINSITKTKTENTYTYEGVDNDSKTIKRSQVELDRQAQALTIALENISENTSAITEITTDLNGVRLQVSSMEDDISDLNDTTQLLQDQIDGALQFWTGSSIPTLSNYPANQWITDDEKNNHLADIYTIVNGDQQGASYRFVREEESGTVVYKWIEITDTEVASIRQDLADFEDEVAQTYVTTTTFEASNGQIRSEISSSQTIVTEYVDEQNTATNNSLDSLNNTVNNINNDLTTTKSDITTLSNNQENFATKVSLQTLTNTVATLQTDTYTKTEINTKLTDGSVTKVDTTTGFTMDSTGFHVNKTGAETNSTLDEKGLSVKDSGGNDVSYVGYVDSDKVIDNPNLEAYEGQTVTYQENAVINHYLQVPNSRIEAYSGGTGVFFTG